MVDVDRFKDINDSLGHIAGDTVLQAIATELDNGTRHSSVVCRYGGDEFVLLLPGADIPGALAVARQLHERIGRLVVPVRSLRDGSVATIDGHSISIGLAARLPGHADSRTLELVMLDADAALLTAKRQGRGRTYLAASTDRSEGGEPEISADSVSTGLR